MLYGIKDNINKIIIFILKYLKGKIEK